MEGMLPNVTTNIIRNDAQSSIRELRGLDIDELKKELTFAHVLTIFGANFMYIVIKVEKIQRFIKLHSFYSHL